MAMSKMDRLKIDRAASPGDVWVECLDCGGCGYTSRGAMMHRRTCRSRQQFAEATPLEDAALAAQSVMSRADARSAAVLDREIADDAARDAELRKLASQVRRSGMTNGRDDDVLEAVRRGYLSESDAMNTDD